MIFVRMSSESLRSFLAGNVYTISSIKFSESLDALFLLVRTLPETMFALVGTEFRPHRKMINTKIESLGLTNVGFFFKAKLSSRCPKKSYHARIKPRDSKGRFIR